MAPALFTETAETMRINQEEVFGPVAAVIRVKNYEELSRCERPVLACRRGIVTTSLKHAMHFQRNTQSGLVMVNLPTAGWTIMFRSAAAKRRATARASRVRMRRSFIRL
jgi:aldehyde dehydrogenase (NAD+)